MVTQVDLSALPAVFVVGGRGTRLGLGDLPKSMVDIEGTPLLERMVSGLAGQGVKKFLFLAGHGVQHIRDHFGDGARFGVEIEIIEEKTPLGTAGAFDVLRERLQSPFLVVYGDVLFDIDVARFVEFAAQRGGCGALYVHPNDHPIDSDLVEADQASRVRRFVSKPHAVTDAGFGCGNLVSAAFYYFDPMIFDFVPRAPDRIYDWGKDILPQVVAAGTPLYAYRGTEYLKDIGTPERIEKGRAAFRDGRVAALSYRHKQRAIFLDRDGVLNREIDGVHRPEQLELLPGAAEAVARINASPYLAICITNQPALAKGFMSFDDLKQVHWRLDFELAQSGAFLDDLFFCPHHPETGFEGEVPALKVPCECRKPKPGLLYEAAERHNIDLRRSFMIGDHERDVMAGLAAGASSFLVGAEEGRSAGEGGAAGGRSSLKEALDEILSASGEAR